MIEDPTIGLYGIEGTYNYGCEAIIRGTEKILRKKWPDANIKYASLRPKDDKKRLKGCNINITQRKLKPIGSIERFNGMSSFLLGLHIKSLFHEDLKWVDDCDMVLSIGGDLYTIYPTHKKSIKPFYLPIVHFGNNIQNREKKLVIWGASIGPFERYPKSINYFTKHLTEADLITSREPCTTSYLKKMGIHENVENCADPAFAVSSPMTEINSNRKKIKIGINLSPLSSYSLLKDNFEEMILIQSKLITQIIKKFDVEIVLIPHVICDFKVIDDDLGYLKKIYEILPEDILDNVTLINKDLGFIGTKYVISNCDIVIATRMHCAINAIEAGIPTIFLSYSQKAKGMAKYIYNNGIWVTPVNTDTNTLLNIIKAMLLQRTDLKSFIARKKDKFKLESYSPLKSLEKILI